MVDQDGRERFIGRDEARLMGMEEQERLMGETSPSPQPSPTRGEGEKIEGPQTWSKGNPYAKKANAAREHIIA